MPSEPIGIVNSTAAGPFHHVNREINTKTSKCCAGKGSDVGENAATRLISF